MLDILSNAAATIAEGEVLQLSAARDLAHDRGHLSAGGARQDRGALFSAATEVGGVIAGAPEDAGARAVRPMATRSASRSRSSTTCWITRATAGATGKNVGDDFRERKLTLPVIKAVAKAAREERAFWTRTIEKGETADGDLDHALTC